ncbi:MAG: His/Gly/Thr/Pro-type tRNA ligase C-terminal domain-containing protein, partial [Gammaproteobacteria bacterium]
PVQAMVLTITDRQDDYARKVAETLKNQGLRADSDLRNEKIGYKIREHTLQRVPYLLVVGDREQQTGSVAVRTRDGKDLGSLGIEAFAQQLAAEIDRRGVSA